MSKSIPRSMERIVQEVLNAPYTRIFWKEEDGGYSTEILEFPGCFSSGDSTREAMANLEEAMQLWVESQLRQGQEIPPPLVNHEFSGRVTLRLPPSLHERATLYAAVEDISLNRFFAMAIAEAVGERSRQRDLSASVHLSSRSVAEERETYRSLPKRRQTAARHVPRGLVPQRKG